MAATSSASYPSSTASFFADVSTLLSFITYTLLNSSSKLSIWAISASSFSGSCISWSLSSNPPISPKSPFFYFGASTYGFYKAFFSSFFNLSAAAFFFLLSRISFLRFCIYSTVNLVSSFIRASHCSVV